MGTQHRRAPRLKVKLPVPLHGDLGAKQRQRQCEKVRVLCFWDSSFVRFFFFLVSKTCTGTPVKTSLRSMLKPCRLFSRVFARVFCPSTPCRSLATEALPPPSIDRSSDLGRVEQRLQKFCCAKKEIGVFFAEEKVGVESQQAGILTKGTAARKEADNSSSRAPWTPCWALLEKGELE